MFPDFFMPAVDPHKLTIKQRLFVLYLCGDAKGNAAEAARMAGSPAKNSRIVAAKWVSKVNVQTAIKERKRELIESIKENQLRTLKMLEAHAFSDIRKLFNEDGTMKGVHEIDDETAAAIEGVETQEVRKKGITMGTIQKVKLTPKASARADLLKVQGLLKDEISAKDLQVIVVNKYGTDDKPENK